MRRITRGEPVTSWGAYAMKPLQVAQIAKITDLRRFPDMGVISYPRDFDFVVCWLNLSAMTIYHLLSVDSIYQRWRFITSTLTIFIMLNIWLKVIKIARYVHGSEQSMSCYRVTWALRFRVRWDTVIWARLITIWQPSEWCCIGVRIFQRLRLRECTRFASFWIRTQAKSIYISNEMHTYLLNLTITRLN